MIQIKDNKVISTENKIIHIIGTDTYGKSFFPARYPLEKYEEVDEIPIIPSRAEYEQKVEELIRERYTVSQELSLLRQKDIKQQEYQEYYEYAEQCKANAKNWQAEKMKGEQDENLQAR